MAGLRFIKYEYAARLFFFLIILLILVFIEVNMKKLTKTLVAATLALGTVSANATILFDNSLNADAWMSVYDSSSKNTFTLNLGSAGLNWSTLFAEKNTTGVVHDIDLSAYADWNTFKASADLTTTEYVIASAASIVSRPGFMLTGADNTFFANMARPAIEGVNLHLNIHANAINADYIDPLLTSSPDTTLVNDADIAQGKHAGSLSVWGSASYNPNTAYGQAADLNLITLHSAHRRTSSTQEVFASQFKLAGDSLTLSSVSAVPVPAAVWMFGSALLGLAGISRKRNAA